MSPEIRNGLSFDESQSQQSLPSPPETPVKIQAEIKEDVEEVDLEDGEIMDEEEEDDGDEVKYKPPSQPVSAPNQQKLSKSARKKRDKEKVKEELDPVKRLLAEVREKDMKDKTEKERERDRRRREKKRSKKDEKDKESNSKKKKRKMSEEEDDGEEFLLVRGASPTGEPDGWGDDFPRNKRHRENEGSASPPHRHHR